MNSPPDDSSFMGTSEVIYLYLNVMFEQRRAFEVFQASLRLRIRILPGIVVALTLSAA